MQVPNGAASLALQEEIINNSMQLTPTVVEHILSDMTLHIEEVFDLKTMIVEAFVQDKDMLNQIFLQVGEKELSFIKRSGFYFGFLFGLLQATAWVFYKGWWVLPLAGFIVGYLTNYLALKMIFKPVNPRPCCGGRYVLHGLFLKRKNEVRFPGTPKQTWDATAMPWYFSFRWLIIMQGSPRTMFSLPAACSISLQQAAIPSLSPLSVTACTSLLMSMLEWDESFSSPLLEWSAMNNSKIDLQMRCMQVCRQSCVR